MTLAIMKMVLKMSSDKATSADQAAVAAERLLIQANIHQSVTSAVQNATDLLNNISNIEATVIGVASAKWLEDPTKVEYKAIIDSAKENISFAVDNLKAVGEAGQSVLKDLKPE